MLLPALSETELWEESNIRPDGTSLIVHSKGDLAAGLGTKLISWAFKIIKACIAAIHSYKIHALIGHPQVRLNVDLRTFDISGSVGIQVPILGYKQLATISGNLRKSVVISWNKLGVRGSITFFMKKDVLWVRLVVFSSWLNVNAEFRIAPLICKTNV